MNRKKGLLESIVIAGVGALPFILWGAYANWDYGNVVILQVACTQGFISFLSTFFSVELLRFIFQKFCNPLVAFWVTTLVGYSIINSLIFLMHSFAGTPERFKTMLPGLIVSLFFCSGMAYRMKKGATVGYSVPNC